MPPTRRQTKRDIPKNTNFRSYSGEIGDLPKLCMLIENIVTILKGVNHFSIQRIVFPAGAKMLICDAVSKFNTGRLPWQPAGN